MTEEGPRQTGGQGSGTRYNPVLCHLVLTTKLGVTPDVLRKRAKTITLSKSLEERLRDGGLAAKSRERLFPRKIEQSVN